MSVKSFSSISTCGERSVNLWEMKNEELLQKEFVILHTISYMHLTKREKSREIFLFRFSVCHAFLFLYVLESPLYIRYGTGYIPIQLCALSMEIFISPWRQKSNLVCSVSISQSFPWRTDRQAVFGGKRQIEIHSLDAFIRAADDWSVGLNIQHTKRHLCATQPTTFSYYTDI